MRAILLAAGQGTRISRHFKRPKCTLGVEDTTIVGRTVDTFLRRGFDVTVVLGYSYGAILDALQGRDVEYFYNPFYLETNSLGSLWFARERLSGEEDLIIANADVYWDERLLDMLLEAPGPLTMAADASRRDMGDYFFGVEDGLIRRYGKDLGPDERTHEYVGLARISASRAKAFGERLVAMTEAGLYGCWWEDVLYRHLDEDPVGIVDASDLFWAEVDYIQDYERIQEYIRTGDVSCKTDRRFSPHDDRRYRHYDISGSPILSRQAGNSVGA